MRQRLSRDPASRDLVLHLPDRLYILDRKRETATRFSYDFETSAGATTGLARERPGPAADRGPARPFPATRSQAATPAWWRWRGTKFARGDLFEVVPSHTFHAPCPAPAAFYERLRARNPAPYEFFFNLGGGEYLVGASPEMYVRVTGDRVETCPIAGTIARGADPLGDAEAIRTLLSSPKEESELTMCTDVDRNDKSRICVPGSIKVIGRRQIEMYSRLIHTVDHIEGTLRPGFDALDAFLTHMWAVTVTGAPKNWAMQFIEDHESQPRRWYGGAVGMIGFDGNMNTGLTLRTAHITGGVAAVRAGATLLFDSDPAEEERETVLKARALLETLAEAAVTGGELAAPPAVPPPAAAGRAGAAGAGDGLAVLLVDHQDSFVHTLAGYFRRAGRDGHDAAGRLRRRAAGRVRARTWSCCRPGPGRRADFECDKLLARAGRARPARVRRVPGPAGDGRARRRLARPAVHPGARQARPGAGARGRAAGGPPGRVHRGQVPLAARPAGPGGGRVRGHRRHAGRRRDGDRGRRPRPVGRAVPPGVDPDHGGRRRPSDHRQRAAPVPEARRAVGRADGLSPACPRVAQAALSVAAKLTRFLRDSLNEDATK